MDHGVYQLVKRAAPEQVAYKDYLARMKAFDLYDIEKVYVVRKHSLLQRGLAQAEIDASTCQVVSKSILRM